MKKDGSFIKQKIIIGISCSTQIKKTGTFLGSKIAYTDDDFVQSVFRGGGFPLMIPLTTDDDIIKEYVNMIDGLILTGGNDVDPSFYGEQPRQKLGEVFPERDYFDMELFRETIRQNKPILGVCRGHEIINVELGGKLLQDLSYSDTELLKHWQGHSPGMLTHSVEIKKDTILHSLFGDNIMVNSFHHQTVIVPGKGLVVSAKSADGTIEAVESVEKNIFSVQWHPEMLSATKENMKGIFKYLVQKSGEMKK